MKKRHRNLLVAGGISVALLFSACNADKASVSEEQTVKETPVQVGEITKGSLTVQNDVIAKVTAGTTADIMPKMVGELVQVHVKKGDKVKKGDVLAIIDNSDQKLAVEMEETSARSTQSQYDQALVSKSQAENAVSNAKIAVKQAELNLQKVKDGQKTGIDNTGFALEQAQIGLNDAQTNHDRMKALYDAGAVSMQQFEQAETALKQAKIALEQAKLQGSNATSNTDIELTEQSLEQAKVGLANAEQQLELANIGIEQAQTGLDSTDLRIQQAKDRLDDSKIIATISGEITAVNGDVGQVASSSAPFATIVDVNQIHVEAQLSADQLASFQKDQEIKVEIPSLNETFNATVTYVSNVASSTGFYELEAAVVDHGGKIKPGMIAKVLQETAVGEEALLVPTDAVIEKGNEAFIFTIKDGKAVQTPVKILNAQTELTAIEGKGLSEKTKLVIKGQNTLMDGNKVRIIKEDNK
ncbi:efflux RND transporter periplasmic adaptor subunit [Bacillus tuaregi]|uniref:efflux RND transporter periplasmic adaptor subunit n=1 Tax=Bacillus tuaregi TaxID=1816695 RepID=UPI0008F9306C|nr:efflux RND transporter periplasmic adaptor subunit [Bacillus tuaregi]